MKIDEYRRSTGALRYALKNVGQPKYKFKVLTVGRGQKIVLNVMTRNVIAAVNSKGTAVRYRPNSAYAPFFANSDFAMKAESDKLDSYKTEANGNYRTIEPGYYLEKALQGIRGGLPVSVTNHERLKTMLLRHYTDKKNESMLASIRQSRTVRGKLVIDKPRELTEVEKNMTEIHGVRALERYSNRNLAFNEGHFRIFLDHWVQQTGIDNLCLVRVGTGLYPVRIDKTIEDINTIRDWARYEGNIDVSPKSECREDLKDITTVVNEAGKYGIADIMQAEYAQQWRRSRGL